MVFLALIISLTVVGRLIFQPIPNVQPVTVIIMIVTIYLGFIDGLIVAILGILLSNIFLGLGPWTLNQIISYAIIVLLVTLLFHHINYQRRKVMLFLGTFIAFLMGLLYGFAISVITVWQFNINHFWVYYINGLPFDLLHAVGNAIFFFLLEPSLGYRIIKPYIQRTNFLQQR